MTVCDIKAKKKEVEKAIQSMLTKLQDDTGCKVSQVNVWPSQIQGEAPEPKPIVITQIIIQI